MLVETRFLVPLREDAALGSGDSHPYDRWEHLQRDLFIMFDGWTLSPGTYKGEYRDPDTGKPVPDSSKQYIIALKEEELPRLRQYLATEVAVNFKQKVIYFFNGKEVELIERVDTL